MKQEQSKKNGLGFLSILALIFITLKLMGYIIWSWWWVTAPLWGGLVLLAVLYAVILLIAGVIAFWEHGRK
ncbi:hypothetical protein JEQ07_18745 [Serratia proteamaculans]|uniref:Transmembrane Fragile-X-F protein n=1 Tax=Serratia proteamaculans TaxID=28151 RepID=A0ABS0TVN4_SERPR|nr:hypothetical protein [Serratia proteamaculans]MBI6182418.1 hypothetical protein [Serratia proteamaculans]